MIAAKIIFGLITIIIFSSLLRVQYSNQLRLNEKIIIIFIFLTSILIISSPSLLDNIANLLNIERGRDLLFYLYIFLSFWGLIRSHIRINKLASSLNKVTSQLAIISSITTKNKKDELDDKK